jgi:hypothetical protein
MLLKSADDKSKRVALLEDLQKSPLLDASQKKWLRDELIRLRKGLQGSLGHERPYQRGGSTGAIWLCCPG